MAGQADQRKVVQLYRIAAFSAEESVAPLVAVKR